VPKHPLLASLPSEGLLDTHSSSFLLEMGCLPKTGANDNG